MDHGCWLATGSFECVRASSLQETSMLFCHDGHLNIQREVRMVRAREEGTMQPLISMLNGGNTKGRRRMNLVYQSPNCLIEGFFSALSTR